MLGRSTMILCDACGKAIPDQSAKEVIYQADKTRYRLELCPSCLDAELNRHGSHRGVPGFRKRAAVLFNIDSTDALPVRERVG
jgi:hypothetical protein